MTSTGVLRLKFPPHTLYTHPQFKQHGMEMIGMCLCCVLQRNVPVQECQCSCQYNNIMKLFKSQARANNNCITHTSKKTTSSQTIENSSHNFYIAGIREKDRKGTFPQQWPTSGRVLFYLLSEEERHGQDFCETLFHREKLSSWALPSPLLWVIGSFIKVSP